MEWVMEHPWMTFFLAFLMMDLLGTSISNICKTMMRCTNRKGDAPLVGKCRDCKFYTVLGHCQVHSQVADECGPGVTVEMLPDDFCSYFTPKEE